jgi:hypothetical protein
VERFLRARTTWVRRSYARLPAVRPVPPAGGRAYEWHARASRSNFLVPGQRVVGSHQHFKHPSKPDLITVPHPKKDLGKRLVHKIRKQAGLK